MRSRRRPVVRLLAVAAFVALAAGPLRAENPAPGDVYIRRPGDLPRTVSWLVEEAKRRAASQILLVLDVVTFAPPPGLTEYSSEYGFFQDLDRWVDAAGRLALGAGSVRATSSLAPFSVEVGTPGWREILRELVRRPWWETESFQQFEPATSWMERLLARTADAASVRKGRGPRLVVLVTGHLTPEKWVPHGPLSLFESEWRTKLLPVGRYWDPDVVASVLERHGSSLYVVAPEARFGDFEPLPEIPHVPWAARPQLPPTGRFGTAAASTPGARRPPASPSLPPEALRALLEESLRDSIPDPEERRRAIEGMLAARRPSGRRTPDASTTPPPDPLHPVGATGRRYTSTTPVWFDRRSGVCLWSNHAPSGYGPWGYARTVARTGGRYLFYPFPDSPWLDPCPTDDALLDRLSPELVPFSRYLGLRDGDAALDAVCRAEALVVSGTPWADTETQHRAATGWSAYARGAPARRQPDWFLRRRPWDDALYGKEDDLPRLGRRLADEVLPAYDEALRVLDDAIARFGDGRDEACAPRAVANLHLSRFWFSMAAFHLEAYSLYAREVDRFIPPSMRGHVDFFVVTYVSTIKLSDCLDAYDGRTLPREAEAHYRRWEPEDAPGYQGNILRMSEDDPNYRAKRSLDLVLLHLDPRLRHRALDMIRSARQVMRRYARTGWGWTTYYSEVATFVFKPVEVERGSHPTPGGWRQPERPTTPTGPSTAPGGSTPGGPATGGR